MQVVHSERHREHAYANEVSMGRAVPAWEVPERAELILAALTADGHVIRPPTEAGLAPIHAVHDPAMIRFLETAWSDWQAGGGATTDPMIPDTFLHAGYRDGMGHAPEPTSPCGRMGYWCFDTATPIVAGTYGAARAAVDVALTAAQFVVDGERATYGLCRPPGHHAARATFGGYCYFNNAAITAEWLGRATGTRIGILDVDFHHGNAAHSRSSTAGLTSPMRRSTAIRDASTHISPATRTSAAPAAAKARPSTSRSPPGQAMPTTWRPSNGRSIGSSGGPTDRWSSAWASIPTSTIPSATSPSRRRPTATTVDWWRVPVGRSSSFRKAATTSPRSARTRAAGWAG